MTDNEKAAHFIGWKPCIGYVEVRDDAPEYRYCACGFYVRTEYLEGPCPPSPHKNPDAPDMSDARNYMKALEAIQARTHHGPIEMTVECDRDEDWKPTKFRWLVKLYKVLEDEHSVHDWLEPVAALAALYDAMLEV